MGVDSTADVMGCSTGDAGGVAAAAGASVGAVVAAGADGAAIGAARDPKGPVVAFFDVDGTLVYRTPESGPGTKARPRVVEAVRAFAAAGGVPVLSTGRSMCGFDDVRNQMPFLGFVTMDGAHVRLGDTVVYDECFPHSLFTRIVEEMCRVKMSAFFQGTEICVQLSPDGRDPYKDAGVPLARNLEDMARAKPDLRFGKIDFAGIDYDRYLQSEYLVRELVYYDVADGCHELVMPGVSKGAGAQRLLAAITDAYGVAPSRVFAFGDSENDISLLRVADEAVAMGQAAQNVKDAATYVTDTCGNDGVATALEHFGLR